MTMAPVHPDQLRITVEMGDQYAAPQRLAAALEELKAALAEKGIPEERFRPMRAGEVWDVPLVEG